MTERPAPERSPEEGRDSVEDEDELHPLLDLMADAGLYGVTGSMVLGLVGLGGLAIDARPIANAVLAVAIVGATVSMLLAAFVGVVAGNISMKNPITGR